MGAVCIGHVSALFFFFYCWSMFVAFFQHLNFFLHVKKWLISENISWDPSFYYIFWALSICFWILCVACVLTLLLGSLFSLSCYIYCGVVYCGIFTVGFPLLHLCWSDIDLVRWWMCKSVSEQQCCCSEGQSSVFVCALSVNLTADPYRTSAHCDVHSLQYHYTSLLSGRGGKLVCVKVIVYKWVNRTKMSGSYFTLEWEKKSYNI